MCKKLALLTLALSLLFPPAFGSPAAAGSVSTALEGFVRNEDGSPLVGAVISIFKENWIDQALLTTQSGRDGGFSLANLSPGKYVLNVVKAGYAPMTYSLLTPLKTTPLFVVLKGLTGQNPNSQNWNIDTVLRTSSDRNIIFRDREDPAKAPAGKKVLKDGDGGPANRSGLVQVTTTQPLGSPGYDVWPNPIGTGFSTRFAYIEPVSRNSTYIVTGMITTGMDSQYRVRNVLDYRIADGHKVQLAIGYDKMGAKRRAIHDLDRVDAGTLENEILSTIEPIQNVNVGIQDYFQIAEPLQLVYGFDINYNSVSKGAAQINPRFQLYLNPSEDLAFRFLLNSEPRTHENTLQLAEGESTTLFSPFNVAKINDQTFVDRTRHMETGVSLFLGDRTDVEVSTFLDQVADSGYPFVAILKSPDTSSLHHSLVTNGMGDSRGFRFNLQHRWTDSISTSVLYVYGSGTELDLPPDTSLTAPDLQNHLNRRFFNIVSTSLNARFKGSGTDISTIYRHGDGVSLTPIDSYSNYYELPDNSLNVFVQQSIPFLQKSMGKWEAIIDVRNILNQGVKVYETPSGDLILVRNARSFRGGIRFRF